MTSTPRLRRCNQTGARSESPRADTGAEFGSGNSSPCEGDGMPPRYQGAAVCVLGPGSPERCGGAAGPIQRGGRFLAVVSGGLLLAGVSSRLLLSGRFSG